MFGQGREKHLWDIKAKMIKGRTCHQSDADERGKGSSVDIVATTEGEPPLCLRHFCSLR